MAEEPSAKRGKSSIQVLVNGLPGNMGKEVRLEIRSPWPNILSHFGTDCPSMFACWSGSDPFRADRARYACGCDS